MKLLLVFLMQLLVLSGLTGAKEFAVANIKGEGVSEGQAKMVSNALRSHLMRESKGDMVPAGVITSKQGTNTTTSASELVSLGKDVQSSLVVGGTISGAGDNFELALSVYNVSSSDKVGDLKLSTSDGFGGIMQTVLKDAALKLAKKDYSVASVAPAVVEPAVVAPVAQEVASEELIEEDEVVAGMPTNAVIGTQPEGAEISLDGEYIGISNLLYTTTTGPHEISVKMDGYRDTTFFAIFTGENNILDIPLYANEVSEDFEAVSEGITGSKVARVATAVVAVGALVGGIVFNSQIGTLNDDLEKAGNVGDINKVTSISDDLKSKQTLRNVMYGVAGAAAVGFGVTFFF